MYKMIVSVIVLFAIVISLFGTGFCFEESASIRYSRYQAEKKEPWIAVLGELFVPTVGYWYANDWPRGIPVLVADIAGLGIALSAVKWETNNSGYITNRDQFLFGYCLFLGATVFACFDSYAATEEFNKDLMKKYGLGYKFNGNDSVIQFSYTF